MLTSIPQTPNSQQLQLINDDIVSQQTTVTPKPDHPQPDDDWLAQLEYQRTLWDDYYHSCGHW